MSDESPESPPFELVGGEAVVRQLVDGFYDLMDLEPRYAHLRSLHGPDLGASRDRLFWFLCGWLGGPQHYTDRFGHPRLRMRHMHVPIGVQARNEWLSCMQEAMTEVGIAPQMQSRLAASFFQTADWMRNQEETARMGSFKSGD